MNAQSESALATSCSSCGGTVPIVFCKLSPPCRYCGSASPLSDAVAQRVARVRAKVGSQEARSQQLIGKQANLGRSYGVGLLVAMMILWLLIFLVGWWTFEPPEDVGFVALMAGGDALQSLDIRGRYWLTWVTLAGVGLTTFGYGVAMIVMRRMVRFALPRAPLASGAPPRCRVCGAELGLEGRVRRCGYCAADHLVMGERYQREDSRLDRELSRMERELGATLERRVKRADQWLWLFSGVMPLLAVVFVPAAAILLDAPTTGLVLLPLLPLGFGIVLVAIGTVMSVPEVRTRQEARPGDTLLVQGQPMQALSRISFGLWPFSGDLFLCRGGEGAHEGIFIGRDDEPCYRVALESGGAAMRADEVMTAQAAGAITPESWHSKDIYGAEKLGAALRGVASVWYYAPKATNPAEMTGGRLWFGQRPDQRDDQRPTFTMSGVTRIESDGVWLLQ